MKSIGTTMFHAAGLRDADRVNVRPGVVVTRAGKIVYAGHRDNAPSRLVSDAMHVHCDDMLLMPLLVDAHTHLDLTTLGPQPFNGDFTGWLTNVMAHRPGDPRASVEQGLTLAGQAGTGFLADVAGSADAIAARAQSAAALPGVSYLECFGYGQSKRDAAIQHVEQTLGDLPFETPVNGFDRGIVLGISPHAPYSSDLGLYESAAKLGRDQIYRLTTHLAESPEELEFIANATGPLADRKRELGTWTDEITPTGKHPVDWLASALRRARFAVVHVNDITDAGIDLLERTGTSVVYCPQASAYFGFGPHRYRDMLEAGVNVALGTDSILCHASEGDPSQTMSMLGPMRLLYQRDAADPDTLLAMATIHGMRSMELLDSDATLRVGSPGAFAAARVDPDDPTDLLTQVLASDAPCRRIDAKTERAGD